MSHLLRARPWSEAAEELARLTRPGAEPSPLVRLAEQLAASPYAVGVYGAVSLGDDGRPVLHLAQTPAFDPERGAVSAAHADGRVLLRYHAAPGNVATVADGGGSPFEALERFFVERRWFRARPG